MVSAAVLAVPLPSLRASQGRPSLIDLSVSQARIRASQVKLRATRVGPRVNQAGLKVSSAGLGASQPSLRASHTGWMERRKEFFPILKDSRSKLIKGTRAMDLLTI